MTLPRIPALVGALSRGSLRAGVGLSHLPYITPSVGVPPGAVVYDSFSRTNRTPLGTADTGQTWASLAGTGLSVISNAAGAADATARLDVIESGLTNCAVTVTVGDPTGASVVVRALNATNYFRLLPSGAFQQVTAGVPTTLGTMAGGALLAGDRVRLDCVVGSIRLFRNGGNELVAVVVDNAATRHGLQTTAAAARFDNFDVRPT